MTKKVISKKATTVAKPATQRPTIKSLTEEVANLTKLLEDADKALQYEQESVQQGKAILEQVLAENEQLQNVISLMDLVKAEKQRARPWLVRVAEKICGVNKGDA